MNWRDNALMLSVRKKSSSKLQLNLLTEKHGRVECLLDLKANKDVLLLPGCFMDISVAPSGIGQVAIEELHQVDGGSVAKSADDVSLQILGYANKFLTDILHPGEPCKSVYAAAQILFDSLANEDRRWPLHFVVMEMTVLCFLGHDGGVERCRSAFNHGDTIYLSPRSGRAASRAEAGAFLDRMIPVPGILLGQKNGNMIDVRQSMDLTKLLFTKFACPAIGSEGLPESREKIEKGIIYDGARIGVDEHMLF